jgi:hypothetical protein
MAGYSDTPLARKLGIKANHRLALLNPPAEFEQTLGELPEGVVVQKDLRGGGSVDVIVLFAGSRSDLVPRFRTCAGRLAPAGGLWIAWPKQASGVATDLSEPVVRAIGLDGGLVDNKICAIDDTWSGLRFVIRLKDRATAKG